MGSDLTAWILTGFVDIEEQMKAVQAERRKLNVTESREAVGRVVCTFLVLVCVNFVSCCTVIQVGLMSTGHYDTMFYSSVDKSGYHDSIAMAEDEEVGFKWKHWVAMLVLLCLQEDDEGVAAPTRSTFSAPQDILNDMPQNGQVHWDGGLGRVTDDRDRMCKGYGGG